MTAAFYQNETKFYVAVDCIILGFDQKELNVLLYKRKFEPMMGQWSLMGGFIKAGESIEAVSYTHLKELVSKQMQINDVMKYARNTNLHLQLYDILKYRITYKGYARSNKQKENLNDLVLSELNLIANHSYQGFEAHKLHLLFQATYYLNAGNYKSAVSYTHLDVYKRQALISSNKMPIYCPNTPTVSN